MKMKSPFYQSVVTRFLIAGLVFLQLSVLLSCAIFTWFSWREFEHTIHRDYQHILQSSTGEIQLYIQEARTDLESLASAITHTFPAPHDREIDLEISLMIAAMGKPYRNLSISLLSTEGQPRNSDYSLNGEVMDYRQSPPFLSALRGNVGFSDVKHSALGRPYMEVAVPIVRLGKTHGVLWGEIDLKSVWDMLAGMRIGQSGHISVANKDGWYISHLEVNPSIKKIADKTLSSLKENLKTQRITVWTDPDRDILCMATKIENPDWIILLQQPKAEIYKPLYLSFIWVAVMICGMSLLMVFTGGWWIRRQLRPLQNLHRQIKKIEEGDLDDRVTIVSNDEISDVAEAVNRMTVALKRSIAEKVVAETALVHSEHLSVLGRASATTFHETRNHLSGVQLFIRFVEKKFQDPQLSNRIRMVKDSCRRIETLARDFQRYGGKMVIRRICCPPRPTIENALASLLERAKKQGTDLITEWAQGLPPVPLDQDRVGHVVYNLVSNSLYAIHETAKVGKIVVSGKIVADSFCLSVRDTGPGIPPDARASIFDAFYTTKGNQGTGLGLSIVKTVMDGHLGCIECDSPPEGGTEFRLFFPLAPPPASHLSERIDIFNRMKLQPSGPKRP